MPAPEPPPSAKSADSSFLPELTLPKGGGALRSIGETFTVNAAHGTSSMSVPPAISPGRDGVTPPLSLTYDSGAGSSPFGLGVHVPRSRAVSPCWCGSWSKRSVTD